MTTIESKDGIVYDDYELDKHDLSILQADGIYFAPSEPKRLEMLRQTKLLDSDQYDNNFDRLSSLAARLFDMPYAAISLVDVNRVWFKSRVGFEVDSHPRKSSLDAMCILAEESDILVIEDIQQQPEYAQLPTVNMYGAEPLRFYAGTGIYVDDVKIGALSIGDKVPHVNFTLEQKENLLDLGAAVIELVKERRRNAMSLETERANIIVSMMHNLRTPMTTLHFATSLLQSDLRQAKVENDDGHTPAGSMDADEATAGSGSDARPETDTHDKSFESSLNEISRAIGQLNSLVDSSLSLGQAIINCNRVGSLTDNTGAVECDLLKHLDDIYSSLSAQYPHMKVKWVVDKTAFRNRREVTNPDAILLVLISIMGQVSVDWKSINIDFLFEKYKGDDNEFPEYADHIDEGRLVITVRAMDGSTDKGVRSVKPISEDGSSKYYNFLSIDRILRSLKGGCKIFDKDGSSSTAPTPMAEGSAGDHRQVYWIPCKILKTGEAVPVGLGSPNKSVRYTNPTQNASLPDLRKDVDMPSGAVAASAEEESAPEAVRQLKALVVEDTLPVQKLLSRWLQKQGCQVSCAGNGKQGLDEMMSTHYDIVLMDFLMPVMLGITAVASFKDWCTAERDSNPIARLGGETLIIGMSATALSSEQEDCFDAGMHFFAAKPVKLELLEIVLNAKRTFATNSEAVDHICTLTDTSESSPVDTTAGTSTKAGRVFFRSLKQCSHTKPSTGHHEQL